MAARTDKTQNPLLQAGLIGATSLAVLHDAPPLWVAGYDALNIAAYGGLAYAMPPLMAQTLRVLARLVDDAAARIPDYIKGTAEWGKSLSELGDIVARPSLFKTGHGAFFGCQNKHGFFGLGRKPILLNLPAVTSVFGATGSGKGILHQLVNCLCQPGPKFICDFDGTDTVMLADALRRKGERVHIINLSDKYTDILGESDSFNPLDHIIDLFEAKGCIIDVMEDIRELTADLLPDAKGGGNAQNDFFWKPGSRELMELAIAIVILLHGRNATLSEVLAMLRDKDAFLHHCQWLCGELEQDDGTLAKADIFECDWASKHSFEDVQNFAIDIIGKAKETADLIQSKDDRYFNPFRSGATQRMTYYSPATRSSKKLNKSTFKFSEQKDAGQDVTVFIVIDSTKQAAQGEILRLIMSIAQKEWVRHPNAQNKTITLFLNEINNWTYPDLRAAKTWLRKFKLRVVLYLQNFSNYDLRYGKGASDTLKSEAEVMLFLPEGLREPGVLDFLEKRLGNKSVMVKRESGNRKGERGLNGYSYVEEAVPLLDADKIRKSKDRGILLVGNKKPFRPYLPSIASVARFRRQIGINPLYGKPFIKPMRLWLLRYEPWMPANMFISFKAKSKSRRILRAKDVGASA